MLSVGHVGEKTNTDKEWTLWENCFYTLSLVRFKQIKYYHPDKESKNNQSDCS